MLCFAFAICSVALVDFVTYSVFISNVYCSLEVWFGSFKVCGILQYACCVFALTICLYSLISLNTVCLLSSDVH
jgi:hypothetical protein